MKTFKKHLTEKAVDGGYPVDGSDFTNDLAKPETVERITNNTLAIFFMFFLLLILKFNIRCIFNAF